MSNLPPLERDLPGYVEPKYEEPPPVPLCEHIEAIFRHLRDLGVTVWGCGCTYCPTLRCDQCGVEIDEATERLKEWKKANG